MKLISYRIRHINFYAVFHAIPNKKVTFEINSIAIAVAIVIIRHKTPQDINKYYSAEELVDEVNNLSFNDIIRIHDISMLQQGLFYFK